ncbi:hypothetical protein JOL62DRAFT_560044 [Phyllosticta paracitricarpa]|uniref:Uncharacterized protein n=1 Tax=Phyllosticta paracitricarpa TaxID=2016321 RepID=A0ABR1MUH9_9PEZI
MAVRCINGPPNNKQASALVGSGELSGAQVIRPSAHPIIPIALQVVSAVCTAVSAKDIRRPCDARRGQRLSVRRVEGKYQELERKLEREQVVVRQHVEQLPLLSPRASKSEWRSAGSKALRMACLKSLEVLVVVFLEATKRNRCHGVQCVVQSGRKMIVPKNHVGRGRAGVIFQDVSSGRVVLGTDEWREPRHKSAQASQTQEANTDRLAFSVCNDAAAAQQAASLTARSHQARRAPEDAECAQQGGLHFKAFLHLESRSYESSCPVFRSSSSVPLRFHSGLRSNKTCFKKARQDEVAPETEGILETIKASTSVFPT